MAFQLKSNRKETENKTIRFPLPLIEEIEKVIQNVAKNYHCFAVRVVAFRLP